MIQYYTALGRYELRTNDRGEKHPVLISSRQEYAPDLCEMLLWSSLLWHIRDQKELETEFARRKKDLHICDDYSLAYYCTRLERLGFLRRGSGYTAVDALFELMAPCTRYRPPRISRPGSSAFFTSSSGGACRCGWPCASSAATGWSGTNSRSWRCSPRRTFPRPS